MAHCINTNSEEFKKLVEQAGIHPALLAAKIGVWQTNNSTEEFPTINDIAIKQGVQELFESNSELSKIGSVQQYSKYLDTVFPESKAKDIVYHGSSQFGFDKFSKEKLGEFTGSGSAKLGFFFSNNLENSFSAYTTNVKKDVSFSDDGNVEGADGTFGLSQIDSLLEDLDSGRSFTDSEIRSKEYNVVSTSKSGGISHGVPFSSSEEALEDYKNDDWNYDPDAKVDVVENILYGKYNYTKVDWIKNKPTTYYKEELGKKSNKIVISEEEYVEALNRKKEYLLTERTKYIKDQSKNRVYNILLNSKDLKEFNDNGNEWREETYVERIQKTLSENKDGLVIKNTYDPLLNDVYVVFEPEQIHILGSKQDVAGFKDFVNKNVIDSSKRKMEDIDYVFSQSPELASIGNKAQYLQYLATIFKTSKVKDVYQHSSNINLQKEGFKKGFGKTSDAFFFDKFGADEYSGKYNVKVLLDVNNIFYRYGDSTNEYLKAKYGENVVKDIREGMSLEMQGYIDNISNKEAKQEYLSLNEEEHPDSESSQFIKRNRIEELQRYGNFDSINAQGYLAVFEPEQIHILGSKQDVAGFKDFVNKNKKNTLRIKSSTFDKVASLKDFKKAKSDTNIEMDSSINKDSYLTEDVIEEYPKEVAQEVKELYDALSTENKEILVEKVINKENKEEAFNNIAIKQIEALKNAFRNAGIDVKIISDSTLTTSGDISYTEGSIPEIRINPNLMKKDTIFHEFSHLYIELLGMNNAYVSQAISQLKGSDIWKRTEQDYPELDAQQLAKEVLAQALGQKGANVYDLKEKENSLRFTIRKIFRAIADLFRTNVDAIERLVDNMASGNLEIKKDTQISSFYAQQKTGVIQDIEELIAQAESNTEKHISDLQRQNLNKRDTLEITKKKEVLKKIQDLKGAAALKIYIDEAISATDSAFGIKDDILASIDNVSKRAENIDKLRKVKDYIESFTILDSIQSLKEFNVFADKNTEDYLPLAEAIRKRNYLQSIFPNLAIPLVSSSIAEMAESAEESGANAEVKKKGREDLIMTKKNIEELLRESTGDISTFDVWFDTMIASKDSLLALMNKRVRIEVAKASKKTKDDVNSLATVFDTFKKFIGKKSVKEMFSQFIEEQDEYVKKERKRTGEVITHKALIQKHDHNLFLKEQNRFFDDLDKKYVPGNISANDHIVRANEIRDWYRDNTQAVEDAEEQIAEQRKLFEDKHIPEEDFKNWYNERVSDAKDDRPMHYKGDLVIPSDKFINPRWEAIQNGPEEVKDFYNSIVEQYLKQQEKLPKSERLGYILPYIEKEGFEKSLEEKFKDAKEIKIIKDIEEKKKLGTDLEGELTRQIPIHHTNYLASNEVTDDIFTSVVKFTSSTNRYEALNKIHGEASLFRDLLSERSIREIDSKGNNILSKVSNKIRTVYVKKNAKSTNNALLMFDEFMDKIFYEAKVKKITSKVPFTENKEIDWDKFVDNGLKYTSILALAGNVAQSTNNVVMGNVMTYAEGAGGTLYKRKNWVNGHKYYLKGLHNVVSDIGKIGYNRSKESLIIEELDFMQGEFSTHGYEFNTPFTSKLFSTNALFFLQHIGEHSVQISSGFAALDAYKVTTKDGREISLLEAYQKNPETGKLELMEGITGFTEEDKYLLMNKIHVTNHKLHGVYNEFDQVACQRYMSGKLTLMFRKWIVPGYKRRFREYQIDYGLNEVTEGTYRTFTRLLTSDMKKYKGNISLAWGNMNAMEKANVKRTIVEINAVLISMALFSMLLGGKPPDEKDGFVNNFVAYQARRLRSELLFFNPFTLGEGWKILKTPSAAMGAIEKTIVLQGYLFDPLAKYKVNSGFHKKGDSKLWAATVNLFPIISQIERTAHPEVAIQNFLNAGVTR